MITKEDAALAANMSMDELRQEYPKLAMIMDYIFKYYPDDKEAISQHKMVGHLMFSDSSNTQIEQMIDKLAIFNGWTKYEPKGDSPS